MNSLDLGGLARALWRSGLMHLSPLTAMRALHHWRNCRNSYAFLLALAAERFPRSCALHDDQGVMTFAELKRQSDLMSVQLVEEYGLCSGQQVALSCRNHRGFVVALLALSRLGADVLLLSADAPRAVLSRLLQQSSSIKLVMYDADLSATMLDVACNLRSFPINPEVIGKSATTNTRELPRLSRAGHIVVLTSGSTGVPKNIRRRPSLLQVLPIFASLVDQLPVQAHKPAVLAIPLYHGYGLATLAICLALAAPLHMSTRYEIKSLLSHLPPDDRPILVSVPTLLKRWLQNEPERGCVSAVITGSAPLDEHLCKQLLDACGPVLFNLYGSTEAGIISLATPNELTAAPGTVGRPLPGNEVQLLDKDGRAVSSLATGRICVNGPLVLKKDDAGWLDTGDLGRIDEKGRLFVVGRSDSMFVSGGENVYPEETESVLSKYPQLADAAIAVVADEEFGHCMVAYVVPANGSNIDEGEIRGWLRDRLERHKLPRTIQVVEGIPRNQLGKIDRRALSGL